MKIEILFLSWVLVFCAGGNLAEASDGGILSAGYSQTCAIDDEGLKCWGSTCQIPPPLKNPTSVAVALEQTCAIDEEGVKCWDCSSRQYQVPPLKNPSSISTGSRGTCAIDDEGVKCWGLYDNRLIQIPSLKNPTSVSKGADHACVIDEEMVKCWGGNGKGQINVPLLKNPVFVSAGQFHTCAIDDEGVKCWGLNEYGQTNVPPLKNPISVSAGWDHTCAIDDEGVKCWGVTYGQAKIPPPLKNPAFISSGSFHICAIDEDGVKCWGDNHFGQRVVPSLGKQPVPLLSLSKIKSLLDSLVQWSTPVRKLFFSSLKPFVDDSLNSIGTSIVPDEILHGRYTLIALLKASIETGDSSVYTEKIIPAYKSNLKEINGQTGGHGLHNITQVKDYPLTRQTSLKVMQVSLSVMTEFLTAEDKINIQDVIKLIGLAMTDVSNKQLITNVLTAIDANEAIVDKLNHSSKTQFLVLTLKTAQQWLRTKIQ